MTPLPRTSTFTIVQTPATGHPHGSPQKLAANRDRQTSGHAFDRVAEYRDHVVDMALLDDQGRRHRKGIAAHAQVKSGVEAIDHHIIAARADAVLARGELDRAHQADIADVDDV